VVYESRGLCDPHSNRGRDGAVRTSDYDLATAGSRGGLDCDPVSAHNQEGLEGLEGLDYGPAAATRNLEGLEDSGCEPAAASHNREDLSCDTVAPTIHNRAGFEDLDCDPAAAAATRNREGLEDSDCEPMAAQRPVGVRNGQ